MQYLENKKSSLGEIKRIHIFWGFCLGEIWKNDRHKAFQITFKSFQTKQNVFHINKILVLKNKAVWWIDKRFYFPIW